MRSKIIIIAGLMITLLVSPYCLRGQGQASAAPTHSAVSSHRAAAQDRNYVIGPEDVLAVDVWKQHELSRSVPVRPDGKISLPLLGDVQAAGLTPMELGDSIQKALHKFVSDPQVTVIVTAINSQRIYILGEVQRPGPEQLYPKMTVLQVLSVAGGLTQFANRKKIYILRRKGAKEERFAFNYKAALKGDSAQHGFVLQPGDTIVVP